MVRDILLSVRRQKRKRFFLFSFFVLLIVFCILAAGIFTLFNSKGLKISQVSVEGVSDYHREKILAELHNVLGSKIFGLLPRDRLFSFPLVGTRARLAQEFVELKNLEIYRELPAGLLVTAEERKAVGVLRREDSDDYFFVDESGFIFGQSPAFSPGLFLEFLDTRSFKPQINSYLLETEIFKKVLDFTARLEKVFPVFSVRLEQGGVYKFYAAAGSYLVLDGNDDWNSVYDVFSAFWENTKENEKEKMEYIDLRFGNKVFFKKQ